MPTDLPDVIRTALHSDQIEASDLRRPTLSTVRDPAARHGRLAVRFLAAATAAAVVVAVAVIVSVAGSGNPDRPHPADGADLLAGIVGFRWTLSDIQDAHGTLAVPTSLGAEIRYSRDGQILGDDSVNALNGRYQLEPGGYQVRDVGSTLAGYGGSDPVRLRTIRAVDSMFFGVVDKTEVDAPAVHVAAGLAGTTLTLSRKGTTLTLIRSGATPEPLHETQSVPATPTDAATSTTAAGDATIRGRLLLVGGPAPGSPRPIAGDVVVRSATSGVTVISVGKDGRYSRIVVAGTYRISGNYDQTVGTSAQIDQCQTNPTTTDVSAGRITQVDVYCSVP